MGVGGVQWGVVHVYVFLHTQLFVWDTGSTGTSTYRSKTSATYTLSTPTYRYIHINLALHTFGCHCKLRLTPLCSIPNTTSCVVHVLHVHNTTPCVLRMLHTHNTTSCVVHVLRAYNTTCIQQYHHSTITNHIPQYIPMCVAAASPQHIDQNHPL